MVGCPIHHLKNHLIWAFSPLIDILTPHVHFHLVCMQDLFLRYGGVCPPPSEKSPHMGNFTSHRHSHLVWTFSPCRGIFTLHFYSMVGCSLNHLKSHLELEFLPHMDIPTSCRHFQLTFMQDHF